MAKFDDTILSLVTEYNLTDKDANKLAAILENGNTIADIAGLTQENLESAYSAAYNYYTAQDYVKAKELFKFLAISDQWDPRFSMGLAGCHQALGEYEDAMRVYAVAAAATSLKDPEPLYYSAFCKLQLGEKEDAKLGLQTVITMGNTAEHAQIRQMAKELLTLLEKEE